jgi:hypothetical protein
MFKHILIFFIVMSVLFLIVYLFLRENKIHTSENTVKYILGKKNLFKKEKVLSKLVHGDIFYVTTKWSTKNNNYFLFNKRYYIIEPGYYYYYMEKSKLVIQNDIQCFCIS